MYLSATSLILMRTAIKDSSKLTSSLVTINTNGSGTTDGRASLPYENGRYFNPCDGWLRAGKGLIAFKGRPDKHYTVMSRSNLTQLIILQMLLFLSLKKYTSHIPHNLS